MSVSEIPEIPEVPDIANLGAKRRKYGDDSMIDEVSIVDGNVELRDGTNGEDGMACEDGMNG